jgi:hypothetical protein
LFARKLQEDLDREFAHTLNSRPSPRPNIPNNTNRINRRAYSSRDLSDLNNGLVAPSNAPTRIAEGTMPSNSMMSIIRARNEMTRPITARNEMTESLSSIGRAAFRGNFSSSSDPNSTGTLRTAGRGRQTLIDAQRISQNTERNGTDLFNGVIIEFIIQNYHEIL